MANIEQQLSTGKTIFVLTVVAGCFAVLWPKIFYPMFFGSNQYVSNLDKAHGGCCDVIFEKDIQALRIISHMCEDNILLHANISSKALPKHQMLTICYRQLFETCNIDLKSVYDFNRKHQLDSSFKQLINIVRSLNSSLCLKYHYKVNTNLIGTTRIIKSEIMKPTSLINKDRNQLSFKQMRQERPPHMRPEMLHPALRENGRAIPREHIVPRVEPDVPPKVIKQPGVPKPGMPRPSFGAAPHPKQASGGIMNLLMPMYTISIVAFFIYTMLRIWDPMCLIIKLILQFLSNNQAQEPEQLQRTSSLEDYSSKYYPQPTESFTQKKIADVSAEKPAPKLVVSAISGLLQQVNKEIIDKNPEIVSEPTKVGYQTDSTNEAAKLIEESSKVPKVNIDSSIFNQSRQNSVVEVEIHDYNDVKKVFDKQQLKRKEEEIKKKVVAEQPIQLKDDEMIKTIYNEKTMQFEDIVVKKVVEQVASQNIEKTNRDTVKSIDEVIESKIDNVVEEIKEVDLDMEKFDDLTEKLKELKQNIEKDFDLNVEMKKEPEVNSNYKNESIENGIGEKNTIKEVRKQLNGINDYADKNKTNTSDDGDSIDAGAVQVINMETTESLKGGQKWTPPPQPPSRPVTPYEVTNEPHQIILEGLLPESSQILVTDELTETESLSDSDNDTTDSVILSSKVTLSFIPTSSNEDNVRKLMSAAKK